MAGGPGFTMVTDAMLEGLREAGATASEIMAYILLVRMERANTRGGSARYEVWMAADLAEQKLGMSARTFSKSLRSLTQKTFADATCNAVPVLTQVRRGCRGHSPHFFDNLGQRIDAGLYPVAIGDPTGHPLAGIGDPKRTNWGPRTDLLGTQNEPIGDPTGHPIRKEHLLRTPLRTPDESRQREVDELEEILEALG